MVFTFHYNNNKKNTDLHTHSLYLQQINTMLLFFVGSFLGGGEGGGNCEIQDPFDGIHIKNNIFDDHNFCFLQHHSIHLKLSLTRKNRETVISFENTWSFESSNPTSTKTMPQALLTVGGGANVKLRSNHKSYSDGDSLNEMTVKLTNFGFVFFVACAP